ncbi:type I DNA topoisomerase [Candidatus Roizmanbacteria bacterium CG10_big_fil_rev_8_21_14_0_10_39_6]|uniref:DNA topoisomerase 1 n=1 Tax=Candidatus Roizmanbacteria bacterium CG10_big_fil_rev_8_21_14_0_10_39_6 TaxID=1974853 RepID=A0A2M8KTN0_9BACT|nr:MAG: type I DNA topoisomerase [Candidatus Roizmanbacteria bacterium CG10_big_fil_rev_8_21_14_0_10_39_6]
MKLIIVESPTKARTFGKFLKTGELEIISSMGHVRDLPQKKLGVDVEKTFLPTYEILPGKKKLIDEIIRKARHAKEVVLATDPDREGEAIAFHLRYVLHEAVPKIIFKRIVFHEITEEALQDALKNPRDIDERLFDAQQARRILDRLVGYTISPYLWKKFSKYWLSAGRVQTVALRFVVEREKERKKFKSAAYYSFESVFKVRQEIVLAQLVLLRGKSFYMSTSLPLFDGKYTYKRSIVTSEHDARIEKERLEKEHYSLRDVAETIVKRSPPPPFITSSLQQHASTTMGYSAKKTMRTAQALYEKGLISYHRTDSMTLSTAFIAKVRMYVKNTFGVEYLATTVRNYKTKVKNAQEAHEAIRPTNIFTTPAGLTDGTPVDQIRLYEAIYKRALATQMTDATFKKQLLTFVSLHKDEFTAEAQIIVHPGFLRLYEQKAPIVLYSVAKGDLVDLKSLNMLAKETQLPPQYTEASLIKSLEKRGIGRPSTYAPIVSLIQERQYARKQDRALSPSVLGTKIADVLSEYFAKIFDVDFTAGMEEKLDDIGTGSLSWKTVLADFYRPLEVLLKKAYENTNKIRVEEQTDESCPQCSKKLVIKISRFGKFYACEGFPTCKFTKPHLQKTGVVCPQCSKGELVVRFSKKKRRFYGCATYPKCDYTSLWLNKTDEQEKIDSIKKKAAPKRLKKKTDQKKRAPREKKN